MSEDRPGKMDRLLDKASTQNIVSGLAVLAGVAGSLYYGKWEILTFILGGAVGYLFPKTKQ